MTPEQEHAQADALRGIAAAAILARRRSGNLIALQSFLADVEHHLNSLIVLGAVPVDTGRPATVSGIDIGDTSPPALHRLCGCRDQAHRADQCPRRVLE